MLVRGNDSTAHWAPFLAPPHLGRLGGQVERLTPRPTRQPSREGSLNTYAQTQEVNMDKTPKVNRGCKASPVKVTKADGTVEMQSAYRLSELRKIKGHGAKPPEKLGNQPPAKNRWRVKDNMVTKNGQPYAKQRRRK